MKALKIILTIFLSIFTIANITVGVFAISDMVKNKASLNDMNDKIQELENEANQQAIDEYYNELFEESDIEKDNIHSLNINNSYQQEIKDYSKYLHEVTIKHVYNVNSIAYYDINKKNTNVNFNEKIIYTFENTSIWADKLSAPRVFLDVDLHDNISYMPEENTTKFNNGELDNRFEIYYLPLIREYDHIAPWTPSQETRQIIRIYDNEEKNISSNPYAFSHWERARCSTYAHGSTGEDVLTKMIITFSDETQTIFTSKLECMNGFKKINLYNVTSMECYFDSNVIYFEKDYRDACEYIANQGYPFP